MDVISDSVSGGVLCYLKTCQPAEDQLQRGKRPPGLLEKLQPAVSTLGLEAKPEISAQQREHDILFLWQRTNDSPFICWEGYWVPIINVQYIYFIYISHNATYYKVGLCDFDQK